MSLGHRTNLASKGKGDNSMCGKRGMAESVVGHGPARPARHGEGCIALSPIPMRGDRTPEVEHLQPSVAPYRASRKARMTIAVSPVIVVGRAIGSPEPDKGMNGTPTSRYDVQRRRTTGSPTGREAFGDGAPIVLRWRAMPPRATSPREGVQVTTMAGAGQGTRDA